MLKYVVILLIIIIIGLVIYIVRSRRKYEFIINSMIQEENDSDVDTNVASNTISNDISNTIIDYVNQSEIETTTSTNTDMTSNATSNTIIDYVDQGVTPSNAIVGYVYQKPSEFNTYDLLMDLLEDKEGMLVLNIDIYNRRTGKRTTHKKYYKISNSPGIRYGYNQYHYFDSDERSYTKFKEALNILKEYQDKEPGYKISKVYYECSLPAKDTSEIMQDTLSKPFKEGGIIYDTFVEYIQRDIISLIEFNFGISVPNDEIVIRKRNEETTISTDYLTEIVDRALTKYVAYDVKNN